MILRKSGEQSGEQIHPNGAHSPYFGAPAPICKLSGRLKRTNRGKLPNRPAFNLWATSRRGDTASQWGFIRDLIAPSTDFSIPFRCRGHAN
jgi:hypothetical protein